MLGYKNKTEAVFALRARGMMPRHIADALGGNTTKEQVKALIWHGKKNRPGYYAMAQIEISEQVLSKLRPFAGRRNMDAETLAVRLLSRCIEDDLVEAVLDDGGEL